MTFSLAGLLAGSVVCWCSHWCSCWPE